MGVDTLLLLAVSAAVVAAIGIAAYRGITEPKVNATPKAIIATASSPEPIPVEEAIQTVATPTPEATPALIETPSQSDQATLPDAVPSVAMAPVPEAPAPFPDETKPTTTSSSTPIPTDISAVTNIASPTENAAPVLVIATPKRRVRAAKRLPSTTGTGVPKRKRTPRAAKTEVVAPTTSFDAQTGVTGQQKD